MASRGLIWLQDDLPHRAMQRVVTLRPSGSAEPYLGERKGRAIMEEEDGVLSSRAFRLRE